MADFFAYHIDTDRWVQLSVDTEVPRWSAGGCCGIVRPEMSVVGCG